MMGSLSWRSRRWELLQADMVRFIGEIEVFEGVGLDEVERAKLAFWCVSGIRVAIAQPELLKEESAGVPFEVELRGKATTQDRMDEGRY